MFISDTIMQLVLFSGKAMIILAFILVLLAGILSLLTDGKQKTTDKITIKNLNEKYFKIKACVLEKILSKKAFKTYRKKEKIRQKNELMLDEKLAKKNVFVLQFNGDIKASEVSALREEITAILEVGKPTDEVVVCLESAGGMVHAYGLAAAQLSRIRQKGIPLTVIVDKIAASGGYLMACVANKILAAPFAMIGSIGVIVQLPNFNRLLKKQDVDFEQITAGNHKRTLTVFGENTREGREKLQEDINQIHSLFKDLIQQHREELDIQKVSTGEVWLGTQALKLKLIDGLTTSDDYLLSQHTEANLFKITYHAKKSLSEKLFSTVSALKNALLP